MSMDLATESRIAAILMREAADLRRQADKEGVHVYLQQPKPRVRPNPRFLAATVINVQQANRSVEMNEMWRIREKEREMDERLRHKSKDRKIAGPNDREVNSRESISQRNAIADNSFNASCSSSDGGGLRDEELEQFLHSRVKRGRGAVGSRMDETGPYLPRSSESKEDIRYPFVVDPRVEYGPKKPLSLKSYESSEEDSDHYDKSSKKRKKERSEKRRSKDGSKDKKKKRKEEKRSKHRK